MRHLKRPWRIFPLIVLIAVAGCHASRPDFMTRVSEDCAAGDMWACELIDALNRPVSAGMIEIHESLNPSEGDQ